MNARYCILILILLLTNFASVMAVPITYQNAVLADNPILYYQFNEVTGNAINHGSLGAGFDARYFGTPTRGATTFGGDTGVAFDAFGDNLVSLTTAPASMTGNPSFTAETIVFVPVGGTAQLFAPFLNWGASSTMGSVFFGFSGNNPEQIFTGFFSGGLQTPGNEPVSRGQWHHIMWVRQGGGAANFGTTLYIDGFSVSLENLPSAPSNGSTPNVASSFFRVNRIGDLSNRFFTGTLDELVLYDRELSAIEVQEHFNAFANAPIPEPTTVVLLGIGLAGLAGVSIRRKFKRMQVFSRSSNPQN